MADKYSTINIPEYTQMYQESKRPELMKGQRERYEKNMTLEDNLTRAIGSIRAISAQDEGFVNALQGRVEKRMSDVTDSGLYHLGNRAVQDSITDFATDQDVMNVSDSYAIRVQELKDVRDAELKGKQMINFNSTVVTDPSTGMPILDPVTNLPTYTEAADSHSSAGGNIYQPQQQEMLKHIDVAKGLMDGIATSPIALQAVKKIFNLPAGMTNEEVSRWYLMEGDKVDKTKMEAVANEVLSAYASTDAGKQRLRYLQQLAIDPTTKNLLTEKQAMDILLDDLTSVGFKQIGSKQNYLINQAWSNKMKNPPPAAVPRSTSVIDKSPVEAQDRKDWSFLVDDFLFTETWKEQNIDPDGNLYVVNNVGDKHFDAPALQRIKDRQDKEFIDELSKVGGNVHDMSQSDLKSHIKAYSRYQMKKYEPFRKSGQNDVDFLNEIGAADRQALGTGQVLYHNTNEGNMMAADKFKQNYKNDGTRYEYKGVADLSYQDLLSKIEKEYYTVGKNGVNRAIGNAVRIATEGRADSDPDETKINMDFPGRVPAKGGAMLLRFTMDGDDPIAIYATLDREVPQTFSTSMAIEKVRSSGREDVTSQIAYPDSTGKLQHWRVENTMERNATTQRLERITQLVAVDEDGNTLLAGGQPARIVKDQMVIDGLITQEWSAFESTRGAAAEEFQGSSNIRSTGLAK